MPEIQSKTGGGGETALPLGTVDARAFTTTVNDAVQQFQSEQERSLLSTLQGGAQSQQALSAYSATARASIDELNSMLGLAPTANTAGSDAASQIAQMKKLITGNESTAKREAYQFTTELLNQAEIALQKVDAETDPSKRKQLQGVAQAAMVRAQSQINSTLEGVSAAKRKYSPDAENNAEIYQDATRELEIMSPLKQSLDQVMSTFETDYKSTPEKALTQEEITAKLQATPGYQFQFDQGQQALERSQAARGLLGSGNAAIEMTQFGQGLANQTYQQYLGNLNQQAGNTLPFAQQQGLLPSQLGQFESQFGAQAATSRLGSLNNLASNQAKAAIATAQNQTSLAKSGQSVAPASGGLFGGLF